MIRILGIVLLLVGVISAPLALVAGFFSGVGWGVYFAVLSAFCLYCGRCWTRK